MIQTQEWAGSVVNAPFIQFGKLMMRKICWFLLKKTSHLSTSKELERTFCDRSESKWKYKSPSENASDNHYKLKPLELNQTLLISCAQSLKFDYYNTSLIYVLYKVIVWWNICNTMDVEWSFVKEMKQNKYSDVM